MKITLYNIRYWLLLLLVFLIAYSSHPSIMDLNNEEEITRGTVLSPYIALVFNVLMLLCIRTKPFLRSRMIGNTFVMLLVLVLFYLITMGFFGTQAMLLDIRGIFISLVAIMIGWQIELDSKKQYVVLLLYAVLVLYVGLMQVFVNIGSFEILEEYKSDNKNSLGVMLAGASFIFLYLGINSKQIDWKRIILLCLFVLTIVVLLTIRARSATLALMAMSLFLFFKRLNKRYLLVTVSIVTFAVVFLYYLQVYFYPDIIDYIVKSFYLHHEDDLTTGRMERNIVGLHFLSDHLWLGNLDVKAKIGWIHNYPLEKLFKFGLVFSLPLLVVYVYIFVKAWRNSVRSDSHNITNIGYYLLLIPYIISLSEPTFPFGPGTACAFNFILFGMSIRQTDLIREKFIQNKIIFIK